MSAAIPSSRKLVESELLNPAILTIFQDPNQPVFVNNVGVLNSFGQIVVPQNNVGTYVQFASVVKDYDFIDVEISGRAALISMVCKGQIVLTCQTGANGVNTGTYTVRLPRVDGLQSLVFGQAGSYTVNSIKALYSPGKNYNKDQNLAAMSIIPMSGVTIGSDGQTLTRAVANATVATVYADPNLPTSANSLVSGYLLARLAPAIPTLGLFFTWHDVRRGWTFTCYNFTDFEFYVENEDLFNYLQLDNGTGGNVDIEMVPKVGSYLPLSTAFGADSDDDIEVVASYYVDSVAGSDGNDGTSPASAFATLAKAQSVVVAGDVVALKRGSKFRESWNQRSGAQNVTLRNYGSVRDKKPIISAFDIVPTGEISKGGGNTFTRISHTFNGADYVGLTSLYENGRQLIRSSVDNAGAGTYWVESTVGFLVTFKIYPYESTIGTNYSADSIYELAVRGCCVGLNDGGRLLGVVCEGNTLVRGCVVMGVNTVVEDCVILKSNDVGVSQHSGEFTGNVITRPGKALLEQTYGYNTLYASTRSVNTTYDNVAVSNIYDTVALNVESNWFDTGYGDDIVTPMNYKGIWLGGNCNKTTIQGNVFDNLYMPGHFSDFLSSNGLTFARNLVRNQLNGMTISGPSLLCDGNFFFADIYKAEGSQPPRLMLFNSAGGNYTFSNNKVICPRASNVIECKVASNIQVNHNTFWQYGIGGSVILTVNSSPTIGVTWNIFGVRGGIFDNITPVVTPNFTAWNNNVYGPLVTFQNMFKLTPASAFHTLATWKVATGFDAASANKNTTMSRAEMGDLTLDTPLASTDPLATAGASSDVTLASFLSPLSIVELLGKF